MLAIVMDDVYDRIEHGDSLLPFFLALDEVLVCLLCTLKSTRLAFRYCAASIVSLSFQLQFGIRCLAQHDSFTATVQGGVTKPKVEANS